MLLGITVEALSISSAKDYMHQPPMSGYRATREFATDPCEKLHPFLQAVSTSILHHFHIQHTNESEHGGRYSNEER